MRLLDRIWALRRGSDGVVSAPAASDVGERYGLVWLAPAEPRTPAPLVEALVAAAPPSTTLVREPSAFARRGTDPSTGASRALVVVLQPEDAGSTRAYGSVLLAAGPGQPLPSPTEVAAAVAAEQRAREDLARRRVSG